MSTRTPAAAPVALPARALVSYADRLAATEVSYFKKKPKSEPEPEPPGPPLTPQPLNPLAIKQPLKFDFYQDPRKVEQDHVGETIVVMFTGPAKYLRFVTYSRMDGREDTWVEYDGKAGQTLTGVCRVGSYYRGIHLTRDEILLEDEDGRLKYKIRITPELERDGILVAVDNTPKPLRRRRATNLEPSFYERS